MLVRDRLPGGPALRVTRIVRGFSQTRVSTLTGIPIVRFQRIEAGRAQPLPSEVARILGVLSSDPDPKAAP